jgi:Zn-finger protein
MEVIQLSNIKCKQFPCRIDINNCVIIYSRTHFPKILKNVRNIEVMRLQHNIFS